MADIGIAAKAISSTVIKLGELLYNYSIFLLGVKGRIKDLRRELSWMQSFLKYAENNPDNLIQKWVSDIRDLAYEAEDVIDTFVLKLETKPIYSITSISATHKLGIKLKDLMQKTNEISSRRKRYGLTASIHSKNDTSKSEEKLKELRSSSPYATDEHFIGLSETVSLLQGKLTSGGSGRFLMSILGMGGLGKTTLARNLYNKLIDEYFQSYAWVCVSQEYDTQAILLQLIKSMINPDEKVLKRLTTKDSMEVYLRDHLNERSFLVVIDDVWQREAWESLDRAFPNNNNNSRVIITTRIRHVAEVGSAYVHELRYMNEDESWQLFCRKSFKYYNDMKCPPNLEQLGKEMVARCSGLPLALITLGGLLSAKSLGIREWEDVRDNLWEELKKDSVHINAVLTLSYKDLSYHLKQCFLHIGMFPEDFEITKSKLMMLWEAESFIGEEEGRPEDIANSYFNELVDRCLVQKTGEHWDDPTCRMHDLLRDLAIKTAKNIDFCAIYDGHKTINLAKTLPHRRLCIYNLHPTIIPVDYINFSLRSFHLDDGCDGKSDMHVNSLLESLHRRFGLLRVLDITVPGEISKLQVGNMIHLRYLGIHCPKVKLPENIGNLKALQTICIYSEKITVPKTMVKLQSLKHMIIGGILVNLTGKLTWIGKLTCLETLCLQGKQWGEIDTTSLVNLRHLSIWDWKHCSQAEDVNSSRFYVNFESLIRLHTLVLQCEGYCISMSEIFKRCPSISHFRTEYPFDAPPDFHEFTFNLEVLDVVVNCGNSLLIPLVQRLPKLQALKIDLGIIPSDSDQPMLLMACSEGGFPQLRILHIIFADWSPQMELRAEEGDLPLLTNLHVNMRDRLIAPNRLKKLITVVP